MLIAVSGHSRGVGKTSLVEALVRAFPRRRFSTLKISAHRHGRPESLIPLDDNQVGSPGERLRSAGAVSSRLLRVPDEMFSLALPLIDELLDNGPNWIVESNRLVKYRKPDLSLFVLCPEITDWKRSADLCIASCDAVVLRRAGALSHPGARSVPLRARILLQPSVGVLDPQSVNWLSKFML